MVDCYRTRRGVYVPASDSDNAVRVSHSRNAACGPRAGFLWNLYECQRDDIKRQREHDVNRSLFDDARWHGSDSSAREIKMGSRSVAQAISDARLGHEVARPRGLYFELVPQLHHVDAEVLRL